jgi:hypothetical protein
MTQIKTNQFEMQFDDDRDGTTTWAPAVVSAYEAMIAEQLNS